MEFIPLSDVKMNDPLWSKQYALVREVVIPYMWEILNDHIDGAEKSHCIENFKVAAGRSKQKHHGVVFLDSDLYKWIEAVSHCITYEPNPVLEELCDQSIELITEAQQNDGYINTYYQLNVPEKRWTNLMEGHELYCAGHLIEAGVAYFKATGKESLLKVGQRFADLINLTFGYGKQRGYPGHPEIELALIRLYDVTNEEKYLSLAGYFLNERGTGEYIFDLECQKEGHTFIFPDMAKFGADYFLAHLPVREQRTATGHAVRAMYLYSAMVDYARLTHDHNLKSACKDLFTNTTTRQMYVTGGLGSTRLGERFSVDFDLPPDGGYCETCASIGLMFFSARMWLIDGNKSRFDIWEQALHNTVLSGMGRDGHHFFYVNPLEVVPQTVKNNHTLSHIKTQRQPWFDVACCPPNLARVLTSIPGYIYALDGNRLFVLTHIGSSFKKGGLYVNLARKGDDYTLSIDGSAIDIHLRLPDNSVIKSDQFTIFKDGYWIIQHPGGEKSYSYSLIPQVQVLRSHPRVSSISGKLCVQRGKTIYCAEQVDNPVPLSSLRLPANSLFTECKVDWLDEDLPVLKTTAFIETDADWDQTLYRSEKSVYQSHELTLIPYSQWGNRGESEMRVWFLEKQ